jgi:hypothetical protein
MQHVVIFLTVICGLLGNYTASCGNYLPTFRDNISVLSSRVKIHISDWSEPEVTGTEVSSDNFLHSDKPEENHFSAL